MSQPAPRPDRRLNYSYSIDDYLVAIYRRKMVIFLVVIAACVISYLVSKEITPRYEAMTVFYVPADLGGGGPFARLPSGQQDHAKAFAEILRQPDAWRHIQARHPEKPLTRFRWDVDIVVPREGVIRVYVRDENPELAAAISKDFANYFNDFQQGVISGDLKQTLARIEEKLEIETKALQDTRDERQKFQEENHISSILTMSSEMENRRMDFEDMMQQEMVNLAGVNGRIETLNVQLAHERDVYEKGGAHLNDLVVNELKCRLDDIEVKLASARVEYTENHPDVRALENQLAVTRRNYEKAIADITESDTKQVGTLFDDLRRELIKLQIRKSETEARIEGYRTFVTELDERIKSIPEMASTLDRYNDEISQLDQHVRFLSENLNDLLTNSYKLKETGLTIQAATVPTNPVFPNIKLNVVVAGIVGLIAGCLYALTLEHFEARQRIRKLKTLERETWIKALSEGVPAERLAAAGLSGKAAPPPPSDSPPPERRG